MKKQIESVEQIQARMAAKKRAEQERIQAVRDKVGARMQARKDAEAQERAAKRQEQEEVRQQRAAAAFDRKHKPAALSAWLATGGTRASFDKEWPTMREEIRGQVIEREVDRRQRYVAHNYRERF